MEFALVDPIISKWAARHRLFVYTIHHGQEARTVFVGGPRGRRTQIWISPPEGVKIVVHAWDFNKKKKEWAGTVDQLAALLEDAAGLARSWNAESPGG